MPNRIRFCVRFGLVLLTLMGCRRPEPAPPDALPSALAAQSQEFERRVYSVTPRVHVAVGYGLANSILVEGDQCAFVVDVLGTVEAARAARAAFAGITNQPIRALVYTHNHADHVFGGPGFVDPTIGGAELAVYAHSTTSALIDRVVSVLRPILSIRSTRMFGTLLPEGEAGSVGHAGIGPALEIGLGRGTLGLVRPTHTFEDSLETRLCGVRTRLVHAPGETPDQILVWLPEERVLLPGDNVYRAFPNLYTIRGTTYRNVLDWVRSLDRMRALGAKHLVPSHTRPVSGRKRVAEILLAYRDAIQFVHDQTIRGMNRGLTPDELVETVRLPPHLRDHPYLQEVYGTVEWSVRSIFAGTLGWFDGDAATLHPPTPAERAAGYAELSGGPDALLAAAREALTEGRAAWSAELAGHVIRLRPGAPEPRRVKARALRAVARASQNANTRHYAQTQALELEGTLRGEAPPPHAAQAGSLLRTISIRAFLEAMPVNLDPEASADADLVVGFDFRDLGEGYTLHVRHGVAELRDGLPGNPDVTLHTSSGVWREILAGWRSPTLALATGDITLDGGALDLLRFVRWFR